MIRTSVARGRWTLVLALAVGGFAAANFAAAGAPSATAAPIGAVAASASAPASPEPADWPKIRDETFDVVWQTVNTAYFDPTFGGVDWAACREKYRARLPAVTDKEQLRALLTQMLGELGRTHFSILPREMSVFVPAERVRVGTAGVEVVGADGVIAIGAVRAGSPGERAGLQPGDEVVAVDSVELAPLEEYLRKTDYGPARSALYLAGVVHSRMQGPVGSPVNLKLRALDGAEREAVVTLGPNEGAWSEPSGGFPSEPIESEQQVGSDGIGYLRFNIFVRPVMKDFRALIKALPANGGLVIDLRGNGGGVTVMAPGMTGWFSDREFLLATMNLREGHIGLSVFPQAHAFLGPIAILVDSGSCSTSEILAAGLQEAGRARVFGEPTPGAALPSIFKTLPSGDLFQYAIADLQTPKGATIEGRGVRPDQTIRRTRADLAAGRDPVLAAAREWLHAHLAPATVATNGNGSRP